MNRNEGRCVTHRIVALLSSGLDGTGPAASGAGTETPSSRRQSLARSSAANISRGSATVSRATPSPAANSSPAACHADAVRHAVLAEHHAGRETGIGKWTADEFYSAMHTGRSPDGSLLYPAMPFGPTRRSRAQDSDAIFAYLQSVAPVRSRTVRTNCDFPSTTAADLAGARCFSTKASTSRIRPVGRMESRRLSRRRPRPLRDVPHRDQRAGRQFESQAFAGGLIPMQNWYAPSLTSDKEAGLGDWASKDIADLLQDGLSARGAVYGPMAEVVQQSAVHDRRGYARDGRLSEEPRPASSAGRLQPQRRGAPKQRALRAARDLRPQCANCHGAKGAASRRTTRRSGATSRSRWPSAVNPIRMVLNGGYPPGTAGNPMPYGMPPFAQNCPTRKLPPSSPTSEGMGQSRGR